MKAFYLLFLLIILSCNSATKEQQIAKKENQNKTAFKETKKPTRKFETSDSNLSNNFISDESVAFLLDKKTQPFSRFVKPFRVKNNRYLVYKCDNNVILFFNIDTQKLYKKIQFDKEGPNGVGEYITGLHLINFDSLFITSKYSNTVYLLDSLAHLKEKFLLNKSIHGEIKKPLEHSTFINLPMVLLNERLYITVKTFPGETMLDEDDLHNEYMTLCYNFKTGFSEYMPFSFAPVALQANKPYTTAFSMIFAKGKFIYNFICNHELYVLDPNHNEVITPIIQSRFIKEQRIKNRETASTDIRKIMSEVLAQKCYDKLLFDEFRNIYYRFVHLGTEISPNEHPFQAGKYRAKFSIIVFDENFNILCENQMPENTYNYTMAFVEKEGLFICENHIKNPDFTEDTLKFRIFKYIQK